MALVPAPPADANNKRSGRRYFPEPDVRAASAAAAIRAPSGKRLFAERRGSDIERNMTAADRHARMTRMMVEITQKDGDDENLEFVRRGARRWVPTGGRTGTGLFADMEGGTSPKRSNEDGDEEHNTDESPPKKVSAPSDRLLRDLKRKPLDPIKTIHDGKKYDVAKSLKRLLNDADNRKRKREAAAKSAAEQREREKKEAKKIDSIDEFVDKHYNKAIQHHELKRAEAARMVQAQRKATTPRTSNRKGPPKEKLSAEEQKAATARLYNQAVDRENAKHQQAAERYIEAVKPTFAKRTPEEIKAAADRLSSKQHV